jgi:hypothetical protein
MRVRAQQHLYLCRFWRGGLGYSTCYRIAAHLQEVRIRCCHGKSSPCQGAVTSLPVLIYRCFLPTNLRLTRASKTVIPLRDSCFFLSLVSISLARNSGHIVEIRDYFLSSARSEPECSSRTILSSFTPSFLHTIF